MKNSKKIGKVTIWIADYLIDGKRLLNEKHDDHPEIAQTFLSVFGANNEMTDDEVFQMYEQEINQRSMKISNYINGNIITDENGEEWIGTAQNEELVYLGSNRDSWESLEGDEIVLSIPDDVGGKTERNCKVIKNQDTCNPVVASDLHEYANGKFQAVTTF